MIARSTVAAFALALMIVAPVQAVAQPAPSFLAKCGELRKAVGNLKQKDDELITIEVEGELTTVKSDGALVYLLMCRPPDPMVLCVTYETNGRKAGERVTLTGSYSQRGPNHILLDPCLHRLPE
ncbi:MAG: hypothetical protein K8F62_02950 [Pseudorhodoplanes sp.]|nr:hypothetical protein [Pseudorhodoplanes sp.]